MDAYSMCVHSGPCVRLFVCVCAELIVNAKINQ